MLRKKREVIVIILCLAIAIYGIISVNVDFYTKLLKDKNNKMLLEQISKDKAPIKIFKGIDEKDDVYKQLSLMNINGFYVFANTNPMNIRIENSKYAAYFNEDTIKNYNSMILILFNRVRSAFLKSISYITSY